MKRLIEELKENKDWRIRELQQLKSVLYFESRNDLSNYELLSKYAIPTSCAIWEGYFKESIGNYYSFYNRNNGSEEDITMLTNIIEHNKVVNKNYQDFETKKRLVADMKNVFENPKFKEEYKPQIGLKKLRDTNKLLERMELDPLGDQYKTRLNTMVNLRNIIIHGEKNDITFSLEEIETYINLVLQLMNELENTIISKSEQLTVTT